MRTPSPGVFLDNAQDIVVRPEPTYKVLQKRFAATVKDAHARGLTSVHDAGFNPISLEFFRRYARHPHPRLRIPASAHDHPFIARALTTEKRTNACFR